ncbi:MAG: hypothetical protein HZB46_06335 [Solirubrobacterales bacterium]|nr:hypothetical protein [Solirubrobacterales bacterium]
MPKLKPIPWLLALELAMVARDHWGQLDPRDRRELTRIVSKSKGRPGNLTPHERTELRRIVSRLDLPGAGRRLLPLAGKHRRRGKMF